MAEDIAIRIGKFLIQTLLGAWPSLGTQLHYEAPGDLQVEIDWPKVGCGTAKKQLKKEQQ